MIYQVYIRSFADSTGDGTGDINGIRSRLAYLRDLGVDGLWVNPWYRSPLHDGGYDVADYRDIHPSFGTLDDAKGLICEAHEHGLRVIVDLVPNHTSDEHAWFVDARNAPPDDPARNRYHILTGKGPSGAAPPNNWSSVFGGSAWERLSDGQWYLHLFDHTQPDLNWSNREVQDEFQDILRFWLDLGADGFRVDVAHGLGKDMSYPDERDKSAEILVSTGIHDHPFWDRDETHTYIRQWRAVLDSYPHDPMMVAEAWVEPDRTPLYVRPDEYHQSFAFDFLGSPWQLDELRKRTARALASAGSVGALPSWTLSNHDVVRHTTRYGLPPGVDPRTWLLDGPHDALDPDLGLRRARAAVLLMLALPGSVYLYQGEELGLPEVWDLSTDVLDDPVWVNSGHAVKGRDGCRVPLPWSRSGPSLGFGDGPPWLPQPASFAGRSVEVQAGNPDSTLELYRSALALRRRLVPTTDEIGWMDIPGILGFRRSDGFSCWVNLSDDAIRLPAGSDVLLRSDPGSGRPALLSPDTAVWFS